MTNERLRELLGKRPFSRFTIHVADGTTVVVKSPEYLRLGPANVRTIEVFNGDDECTEFIDLLLVTKLSTTP
jgi:hypothetical protein